MAKIKLTKNELKKQKDALKRFERYLPTLMLKKQQLQMVIRQVEAKEREKRAEQTRVKEEIDSWIEVFGEPFPIEKKVEIDSVETEIGNIAGVDIPVFRSISFLDIDYDLFLSPLWIDRAIDRLKEMIAIDEEVKILQKQVELLALELRTTTQRVNLFEKVKIPETREHIRVIGIYLGDQQTAAVVRGKIAKNKIVKEVLQ
jgi:V/A-type H+-transporting ATPase subunit D